MRLVVSLLSIVLSTGWAVAEPVVKRGPRIPAAPANPDAAAIIETRAAREAEQQALRNARFDAQVRRVTGSVCLGCVAADPVQPRRR